MKKQTNKQYHEANTTGKKMTGAEKAKILRSPKKPPNDDKILNDWATRVMQDNFKRVTGTEMRVENVKPKPEIVTPTTINGSRFRFLNERIDETQNSLSNLRDAMDLTHNRVEKLMKEIMGVDKNLKLMDSRLQTIERTQDIHAQMLSEHHVWMQGQARVNKEVTKELNDLNGLSAGHANKTDELTVELDHVRRNGVDVLKTESEIFSRLARVEQDIKDTFCQMADQRRDIKLLLEPRRPTIKADPVPEPVRDEVHHTPRDDSTDLDLYAFLDEILEDPNPTDHINMAFMKALLRRFPDLKTSPDVIQWVTKNWAQIIEKV